LIAVGALGTYDAARYLGISIPTLRRQVRAGKLRPNRYTRHLLFSVRELSRWIEEGQVE
jgi:excisionase family DNA binding protein